MASLLLACNAPVNVKGMVYPRLFFESIPSLLPINVDQKVEFLDEPCLLSRIPLEHRQNFESRKCWAEKSTVCCSFLLEDFSPQKYITIAPSFGQGRLVSMRWKRIFLGLGVGH